ncbi:MAG: DNA recombination protein RmuC, partial [Akkermansia sp.]|nr:DNA recombination protein RmuC [Akkermansia sp.]
AQPELTNEAYRRGVLIVSPTNLLMALQLAYNLWQNEARVQNVEAIFDRAGKLYDKYAEFYATFQEVGKKLDSAAKSFQGANNLLHAGSGNFVRQVAMLQEMGAQPKAKSVSTLQEGLANFESNPTLPLPQKEEQEG